MKKIFFITALIAGMAVQAQVSTTRINDVKLGMSKTKLEKVIGQKIRLKLDENGYPDGETTFVSKGVTYRIYFNSYDENNVYKIYSIKSSDSSLKTLSGIKIGSTLDELLSKYKDLNISVYDGYDEKAEKRSKTTRYFQVEDYDAGTVLQFDLVNGKVTMFNVYYNEGC